MLFFKVNDRALLFFYFSQADFDGQDMKQSDF